MLCLLVNGCERPLDRQPPSIEFTKLPPAAEGSPTDLYPIQGRVNGARKGQSVVLFARSGVWWVQPLADQPFTKIQRDSTWKATTHPGTAYAALLVDASYRPPATANLLPETSKGVLAIATAEGDILEQTQLKRLDFSGYEWMVRQTPGNPAGSKNEYDPANSWVDSRGFLHLRIAGSPGRWTSAELSLSRSLGYGSYRFVVSGVSQLEPAMVLNVAVWDGSGPDREMDIEISRWGATSGKNAQYVVQPYYVPANVVRFLSPPGRLTYSFDWEPGRVSFRTVRGSEAEGRKNLVAAHTFTSGVPASGGETVRLHLYVFDTRPVHMQHGAEVVIEKFEYLP